MRSGWRNGTAGVTPSIPGRGASPSLTLTETNAHLHITKDFGPEAAKTLVRDLDQLAQAGDPSRDVEAVFQWDADLPQVDVGLTNESMHRLQETFRRCEPRIQETLASLNQGWVDAPVAAPRPRRGPAIDLHWNLAQGDYAYLNYVPEAVEAYQKWVSALPGFWLESPSAALELGSEFTMKHVEKLLEAMVGLREAAPTSGRG